MLSKTRQLEENGDIRIFSELNVSKILYIGDLPLTGRCGSLACGLMFPVAGQMLYSPFHFSLSEDLARTHGAPVTNYVWSRWHR